MTMNLDLSNRALLVGVTINLFSGEKTDKRVAEEVARNHNTTAQDAGRFQKALISKKALEAVKTIGGEARTAHYQMTLPWLDNGQRLLSIAGYETYGERMSAIRSRFDSEVERFITLYPSLIEDARHRLNGMFDEGDYPPVSDLRRRFVFDLKVLPFPNTKNWLVDEVDSLLGTQREALRAEAADLVARGVADATRDIFERVATATGHMATKLRGYVPESETGRPAGVFRDSLVENVRDLYNLLPTLNVTGDARIDELRDALKALTHHNAADLRADDNFRQTTAEKADAIYQQAIALMG